MTYFPSHKNNPLKILQFITSQKELAFYEIFTYRILVRKIISKRSMLTLKLLIFLKNRLCLKERLKISRVNNPKTKNVCT